jgi:tRNA A37 threonylcarbamoyladenosine dehydratase
MPETFVQRDPAQYSYDARFGGVARLVGAAGLARLSTAHVCLIGLGGVGSWVAEALARSGIGKLTLIDLDDICISNVNRQIHAVTGTFGQPKVDVLAERCRTIQPLIEAVAIRRFFTGATAAELLSGDYGYVVDAIDQSDAKALLIAECRRRGIPVVTSGGAGGRCDPTRVRWADLAETHHDRLMAEVRRRLRRDYGFPSDGQRFGVLAVFSEESQVFPTQEDEITCQRPTGTDLRLDCRSGFGTASFVTGTFGFVAASLVVRQLAGRLPPSP